ncbi:MAG: MgtC/SapB family protein [Nitrososphaeria archaeon]
MISSNFIEGVIGLLMSIVFGAVIGLEREITHKPAGLRTHMLVCLGSCIFTIVSLRFGMDPARVAAGIVTGIGFIGAGTIIAEQGKVVGITTAASLWVTAAIGLTIGIGEYLLSAVSKLLVFLILTSKIIFKKIYST